MSGSSFDDGRRDAGESAAREAARAAEDLREQAGAAAADVRDEVQRQAYAAAEAGREAARGRLDNIVAALRASASELSGREDWLAGAVDAAAEQLRLASTHVRDQDVDSLADDACEFARRHPAAFIGGAVALGFALSRIATARRRGYEETGPERRAQRDLDTALGELP